jgi:GNAT superfamily N-acetyltransferase
VISWAFPRERTRLRAAERFFGVRLRQLLGQGESYTTDDLAGGAIWAVPDRWAVGLADAAAMAARVLPDIRLRLPLVWRGLRAIERDHPHEPHYYLSILGTDPARQGEGIGSALMRPILEACDRDGVPAYLEASKERNVDYYTRHGFRATGELELPRGPRVWPMWREPRG